jgi:hypothetical protein
MKTQAWGWLIAGIMALGLNGFYQDGGFAWAHRAVNEVQRSTGAVLALASGRADRFLAQAQWIAERNQTASCPLSNAVTRIQTRITQRMNQRMMADAVVDQTAMADAQSGFDRIEAMSAREEAQMEANRARREEHRALMQSHLQARLVRLAQLRNVSAMQMVNAQSRCPRVRVNIPRVEIPRIEIPRVHIPEVHVPHISIPALAEGGSGPV